MLSFPPSLPAAIGANPLAVRQPADSMSLGPRFTSSRATAPLSRPPTRFSRTSRSFTRGHGSCLVLEANEARGQGFATVRPARTSSGAGRDVPRCSETTSVVRSQGDHRYAGRRWFAPRRARASWQRYRSQTLSVGRHAGPDGELRQIWRLCMAPTAKQSCLSHGVPQIVAAPVYGERRLTVGLR
jgi:hypothetical protein